MSNLKTAKKFECKVVGIDVNPDLIEEALRVIKSSGLAGWIELTWQQTPTELFMKQVSDVICAYCMLNVKILDGWKNLFIQSGASNLRTDIYPLNFSGFPDIIKDEGFTNFFHVMRKYLTDSKIRTCITGRIVANLWQLFMPLSLCTSEKQ